MVIKKLGHNARAGFAEVVDYPGSILHVVGCPGAPINRPLVGMAFVPRYYPP